MRKLSIYILLIKIAKSIIDIAKMNKFRAGIFHCCPEELPINSRCGIILIFIQMSAY